MQHLLDLSWQILFMFTCYAYNFDQYIIYMFGGCVLYNIIRDGFSFKLGFKLFGVLCCHIPEVNCKNICGDFSRRIQQNPCGFLIWKELFLAGHCSRFGARVGNATLPPISRCVKNRLVSFAQINLPSLLILTASSIQIISKTGFSLARCGTPSVCACAYVCLIKKMNIFFKLEMSRPMTNADRSWHEEIPNYELRT